MSADKIMMTLALDELGFSLENTGGGCEAYVAHRSTISGDVDVYITVQDDPSAPESLDDAVTIGFYPITEDGEMSDLFTQFNFDRLYDSFEMLAAFVSTNKAAAV